MNNFYRQGILGTLSIRNSTTQLEKPCGEALRPYGEEAKPWHPSQSATHMRRDKPPAGFHLVTHMWNKRGGQLRPAHILDQVMICNKMLLVGCHRTHGQFVSQQ